MYSLLANFDVYLSRPTAIRMSGYQTDLTLFLTSVMFNLDCQLGWLESGEVHFWLCLEGHGAVTLGTVSGPWPLSHLLSNCNHELSSFSPPDPSAMMFLA